MCKGHMSSSRLRPLVVLLGAALLARSVARAAETPPPANSSPIAELKKSNAQLDKVLQGEFDEFTEALGAEERRRALEQ